MTRVLSRLENQGLPREAIAERMSDLRNVLKMRTRNFMADRALADSLPPVRPFEFYLQKYSTPPHNLTGDALYNRIIEGSLTPNPGVNAQFGIKH